MLGEGTPWVGMHGQLLVNRAAREGHCLQDDESSALRHIVWVVLEGDQVCLLGLLQREIALIVSASAVAI